MTSSLSSKPSPKSSRPADHSKLAPWVRKLLLHHRVKLLLLVMILAFLELAVEWVVQISLVATLLEAVFYLFWLPAARDFKSLRKSHLPSQAREKGKRSKKTQSKLPQQPSIKAKNLWKPEQVASHFSEFDRYLHQLFRHTLLFCLDG